MDTDKQFNLNDWQPKSSRRKDSAESKTAPKIFPKGEDLKKMIFFSEILKPKFDEEI